MKVCLYEYCFPEESSSRRCSLGRVWLDWWYNPGSILISRPETTGPINANRLITCAQSRVGAVLCFYKQNFGLTAVFKLFSRQCVNFVWSKNKLSEKNSVAVSCCLGRNQHTRKPDVTKNLQWKAASKPLLGIDFFFFFCIIISVNVGGHVRTCRLSALFEIELEAKSSFVWYVKLFQNDKILKPLVLVPPSSSTRTK